MFALESDGSSATEDALPAVACVIPAPTRASTKDRADNLRLVAVACLFFQATVVGLFALLQHADGAVSLPEAFLLQLWLFAIACVVTVLDARHDSAEDCRLKARRCTAMRPGCSFPRICFAVP